MLSDYAMERLGLFATLPDGWYENAIGKRVTTTTFEYTAKLLEAMRELTPEPSLTATYQGGIGVSWKKSGDDGSLVDVVVCETECSIWEPIYYNNNSDDDDDDNSDIYDMRTEFDELCAFVRNRLLSED